MIEQVIEAKVIERLIAALLDADIKGVEVIGAWQVPSSNEDVKGLEVPSARGYLSVKVAPRAFDTYTMSDGEMEVRVELNMRAECDQKGADYLLVTQTLSQVIYAWHKNFTTGKETFDIQNEFNFTGFRLAGGDCGIDRANMTWTWLNTFVIQGIFNQ